MQAFLKKYKWESILYGSFVVLYLILIQGPRGPVVFPDEAGYIGWARLLTGQGGDGGLLYFPGYSLLLVPLTVMFKDITALYPSILMLNGLLCSFLPVGLYRLTASFLQDQKIRVLTAVSVALYPSYLMYANAALCENLLCVGFVFLLLSVDCMVTKGKYGGVLFWAVLLSLTHTRAFALLPALGVLILLRVRGKQRWGLLGLAGAVFLAGVCYLLFNQNSINTAHLRNQLLHLFTKEGIVSLVTVWISQQLYLIMSTFGFYLFGWWYGIRLILKKEDRWQTVLFVLLSVLFTGALSALYLYHHERPEHLFYGRYNEYVLSGCLLLGLLGWYRKKVPLTFMSVWFLFAGITWAFYREPLSEIGSSIIHTLGVLLYRLVLTEFDLLLISLFFFCLAVFLFLAGKKKREYSMLALSGIYLLSAFVIKQSHFDANNQYGQPDCIKVIEQFMPTGAVQIEGDPLLWEYNALRVYAPRLVLSQKEEGQSFLLSKQWYPEKPLLSSDRRMDMYLYAKDDETAQWYAERGMLLSKQENFSGTVSVKACSDGQLTLTFTNTGDPWVCMKSIRDGSKAVRVGVRVLNEKNETAEVLRFDLEENILRGGQAEVAIPYYERMAIELVRDFSDEKIEGTELVLINGKPAEITLPREKDLWFSMLTFYEAGGSAAQQLTGFYHQYAGPEAEIKNINIEAEEETLLRVETENRAVFRLWANGEELELADKGETYCDFVLKNKEEITSLRFESKCYNPFAESGLPGFLSFISIDSRIKPAAWLAEKIPQWNNHDYGPAIRRIRVIDERREEDAFSDSETAMD